MSEVEFLVYLIEIGRILMRSSQLNMIVINELKLFDIFSWMSEVVGGLEMVKF